MRRRIAVLAVLLCAVLIVPAQAATAGAPTGATVTVIVKASADQAQAAVARLDQRLNVLDAEALPAGAFTTVEVPAAQAHAALARLNADPAVDYAELDAPVFAAATPTDPFYSEQWGVPRVGMDAVWDTTMGRTDTVVAVLDSGVEFTHPDFAGTSFVPGYDYVNKDDDPRDDFGHGTSVTGIIAAQHNGVGIAGLCPRCTILPLKVLGSTGGGSSANVADAIGFAVAAGVDVINLSLAGTTYVQALADAVRDAAAAGVVVVAAAGNADSSSVHYPAGYPGAMAVAASNPNDVRRSGSNYGDWVHLAAPGCSPAPALGGTTRSGWCGTSAASAVVAGMIGSLASPRTSRASLTSAVFSTAVSVPGGYVSQGRASSVPALGVLNVHAPEVAMATAGGWVRGTVTLTASADDDYGVEWVEFVVDGSPMGRRSAPPWSATLNTAGLADGPVAVAARAGDRAGLTATSPAVTLRVDNTPPSVTITAPAVGESVSGTTTFSASVADAAPVMVTFRVGGVVVGTDATAPYSVVVDTTTLAAGDHLLSVTAADAAGNQSSATRSFTVAASGGGAGGGGGGGGPAPSPSPEPTPTVAPTPLPPGDPAPAQEASSCDGAPSAGFSDVGATNPHGRAIDCAVHRAIASGRTATSYAPAGGVTRAQMATFIANAVAASGAPLPAGTDAFGDDDASVHEAAINRLAGVGIVQGVRPGRYNPGGNVTREQMATFLVRAAEYIRAGALPAAPDAFSDDDGRPHEPNINKAAAAGLASGVGGSRYAPAQLVRRDQMATFIVRLLDWGTANSYWR